MQNLSEVINQLIDYKYIHKIHAQKKSTEEIPKKFLRECAKKLENVQLSDIEKVFTTQKPKLKSHPIDFLWIKKNNCSSEDIILALFATAVFPAEISARVCFSEPRRLPNYSSDVTTLESLAYSLSYSYLPPSSLTLSFLLDPEDRTSKSDVKVPCEEHIKYFRYVNVIEPDQIMMDLIEKRSLDYYKDIGEGPDVSDSEAKVKFIEFCHTLVEKANSQKSIADIEKY